MPKDWQRLAIIVLGILLGVVVSAFTTVYISDRNKINHITQYQYDFMASYGNKPPQEQLAILANIFRTQGVILELDEGDDGRKLFFNSLRTWEDQKALFVYPDSVLNGNPQLQENLVVVIQGIYFPLTMRVLKLITIMHYKIIHWQLNTMRRTLRCIMKEH